MVGPTRLFLEITTECNLRCKLCKLWQNTDPPSKIGTSDKVNLLTNLADWLKEKHNIESRAFPIIFTGGEPFRNSYEVWELARFCSEKGFPCYVNSNGTLLRPHLPRLPSCGLSAITISLDSHLPSVHDDLRGIPGTYEKTLANLKDLIQERNKQKTNLKIYIQSILGSWNIDDLETHAKWAASLGVDGLMFQCIQYPFGPPIPRGWHQDFPYYPALQQVQDAIRTTLNLKEQGLPIVNATEEIRWWETYFHDPENLPVGFSVCCAADQNLIVDINGIVKFCFNKQLEPVTRIGKVPSDSFDALWSGTGALQVKQEMRACNRSCGIMACHCDSNIRTQK